MGKICWHSVPALGSELLSLNTAVPVSPYFSSSGPYGDKERQKIYEQSGAGRDLSIQQASKPNQQAIFYKVEVNSFHFLAFQR